MKRLNTIVAVLMVGIFFGCASITKHSVVTDYDRDADFEKYKTFYWSDNFQIENGEKEEDPLFYNSLIKKRLKVAIEDELIAKGYKMDKQDPNLLVEARVTVEQKDVRTDSYPYKHFYYPYYGYYGSSSTQYKEGGVIVELIDKDRRQLVWQGYAPDVLQTNTKDKQEEIREAVSTIFAKYTHDAMDSKMSSRN